MAYIPSSKILKKYTKNNNELIVKRDNRPYNGPYMESSDGKLYMGHNSNKIGPELIKKPLPNPEQILLGKKFGISKGIRTFNIINKDLKKQIQNTISPSTSKPYPTERDYTKGFFIRYFLKRINGNFYIEIKKSIYDSISNKESKYDDNLYIVGSIRWYISGPDTQKRNALNIKNTEIHHKNITHLFPVLNEYVRSTQEVQEDLITQGGELYYEDGTEYIGQYHVHPLKGPMEGPKHTDTPHSQLYYQKHLPQTNNVSYNDYVKQYDQISCYRCINIPGTGEAKVVSSKVSRFVGCPENSFTTHIEAEDSCPGAPEIAQIDDDRGGY